MLLQLQSSPTRITLQVGLSLYLHLIGQRITFPQGSRQEGQEELDPIGTQSSRKGSPSL